MGIQGGLAIAHRLTHQFDHNFHELILLSAMSSKACLNKDWMSLVMSIQKKKQIMALDPKGLNASRGWSSVWLLMT